MLYTISEFRLLKVNCVLNHSYEWMIKKEYYYIEFELNWWISNFKTNTFLILWIKRETY